MPRAEAGTTKAIANKMKSKGLQRLRWYCQPCGKQCRDENGFKCHTQSESHVRQMMVIGENSSKVINDYSSEFVSDFVTQLRVSHNTKPVLINHFYQSYIGNKDHIHMNSTKWKTLTEFAKHLGQQGICRVEETDKGLHVAWIDNSPEALRRQEAVRKRERLQKNTEDQERRATELQLQRAHAAAREAKANRVAASDNAELTPPHSGDEPTEAGQKRKADVDALTPPSDDGAVVPTSLFLGLGNSSKTADSVPPPKKKLSVFAAAKKEKKKRDASAKQSTNASSMLAKPTSEAERIMREEMARQQRFSGGNPSKKQRVG